MVSRRKFLLCFGSAVDEIAAPGLPQEWRRIFTATDGIVGVAALHLGTGQRFSVNGDDRFPLASICKLPIAINLLALIDEGEFTLDQQIEILPRDETSSVSVLAEQWPTRRRFPLIEIIELMVTQSDNTAVETLFRIGGGSRVLTARFHQWEVDGIRVDRSERQCGLDRNGVAHYPPASKWTNELVDSLVAGITPAARYRATLKYLRDPRDTGTPNGTVQLLARAFRGELLSTGSTARLIKMLKATTTFPMRLKGLLPSATIVAHKTGSTGTVNGLTAATNDSGVIFLPDGGMLAVSVYVKASTRDDAERDAVIARSARAAFDHFEQKL